MQNAADIEGQGMTDRDTQQMEISPPRIRAEKRKVHKKASTKISLKQLDSLSQPEYNSNPESDGEYADDAFDEGITESLDVSPIEYIKGAGAINVAGMAVDEASNDPSQVISARMNSMNTASPQLFDSRNGNPRR